MNMNMGFVGGQAYSGSGTQSPIGPPPAAAAAAMHMGMAGMPGMMPGVGTGVEYTNMGGMHGAHVGYMHHQHHPITNANVQDVGSSFVSAPDVGGAEVPAAATGVPPTGEWSGEGTGSVQDNGHGHRRGYAYGSPYSSRNGRDDRNDTSEGTGGGDISPTTSYQRGNRFGPPRRYGPVGDRYDPSRSREREHGRGDREFVHRGGPRRGLWQPHANGGGYHDRDRGDRFSNERYGERYPYGDKFDGPPRGYRGRGRGFRGRGRGAFGAYERFNRFANVHGHHGPPSHANGHIGGHQHMPSYDSQDGLGGQSANGPNGEAYYANSNHNPHSHNPPQIATGYLPPAATYGSSDSYSPVSTQGGDVHDHFGPGGTRSRRGSEAPVPVPISMVSFPLDSTRYYLLGQLEYYMSEQNMVQDFWLRQKVSNFPTTSKVFIRLGMVADIGGPLMGPSL
jgi:hypothetical protein